ncbi:dTDP-D-glucose 4,6-dehydratase [Halanaeroarchaeum sp. HSR-CO]|uniref:dTDP-glucose 4,6-dehydratase n=1 Tax=Halanaeroarchaeum sp. HSR-CO TaxID=2866382 RepID=UPI00217CEE0A|nr:dTDP-glucose 4,6-dehydratase [Halanaeroarchaeum sp. HSR-CO]UWG48134.1 dTDP-D-glucose 4,6-dehydratase [Halanaeroarchaeum sp. HSR-CO]
MRILVTGGAGFIGSNFVKYVLENRDYEVTTLDSLTYAGTRENLDFAVDDPNHRFVEGDIRDEEVVEDLLSEVDAIVNFAAESHVDRSIDGSKPFVSTNIEGTRVLLDLALKEDIDTFVQISTDEVYGEVLKGVFSETDPLEPRNPYAATKASADLLAMSYFTTHDLPVIVTRSSNNYGPRQHPEKLVPKFIKRANEGKSLPVYGDGSQVREWLYVEDNCRAVLSVLEAGEPGEIYNIGSGVEKENIEMAITIVEMVGASADLIEYVEDRPGHDQRYALETEKIEALGWQPEVTFQEGMRRTVDYFSQ